MDASEFVSSWKEERDDQLVSMFAGSGATGQLLQGMQLSEEQVNQLWHLLNVATTDLLYTLLLGLEGCAGVGNSWQQRFVVHDEEGNRIEDIEGAAYECFQEVETDIPALQARALARWRESRAQFVMHEVLTVTKVVDGIVRCPHCRKSFSLASAHSWDGRTHRSCGRFLRIDGLGYSTD
ncbi:hypothetical protein [Stenotrophomonas sp. PS02289]|uniref:hypothetical protein n=1 Tax=Stenotrophomonas sp. PS02289 TaxID=2991422 RepID=UPI00249C1B92|nr:hypothetical protein [Stenotrophomonas sp. PS02289]